MHNLGASAAKVIVLGAVYILALSAAIAGRNLWMAFLVGAGLGGPFFRALKNLIKAVNERREFSQAEPEILPGTKLCPIYSKSVYNAGFEADQTGSLSRAQCPKCGYPTSNAAQNCVNCRINLQCPLCQYD